MRRAAACEIWLSSQYLEKPEESNIGHFFSSQNRSRVGIITHFLQPEIAVRILVQEGVKLSSTASLGRSSESKEDREWLKVRTLAISAGLLKVDFTIVGLGSKKIILFVYFSSSATSFLIPRTIVSFRSASGSLIGAFSCDIWFNLKDTFGLSHVISGILYFL